MNKQDITAVVVLVALLLGWFFFQSQQTQKQAKLRAEQAAANTNLVEQVTLPQDTVITAPAPQPPVETAAVAEVPDVPRADEIRVALINDSLQLTLSSHGGVIQSSTLPEYHSLPDKMSDPVAFDYGTLPVLAWSDIPNLAKDAAYLLTDNTETSATFVTTNLTRNLLVTRVYTLESDYALTVRDTLQNISDSPVVIPTNRVSLGNVTRGSSKNDMLGIDALASGQTKVAHLQNNLVKLIGGSTGGLGCKGASAATRDIASETLTQSSAWVALKSRFFAHFYTFTQPGASLTITSEAKVDGVAVPQRVSASIAFAPALLEPGQVYTRDAKLYIGPKRLSVIKTLGPNTDQIMEFGFFAWFCKLLVPVLNFFYSLIPNYGVAIILLTFLVRILFWPLTHKTAESSRKMAAIQPKVKELQAKFKDNPQKLQQETWALYRAEKVNPLASCLPMLIQLPVFFALFTVLRSAVELRYAPFLWVADLSEPENLFPGLLPLPINILPIFMAATMALQSYLTPSMGDPAQQKMMMWMMPAMMLFICYGFPSALALYWTASQIAAIIQLAWQRRRAARENAANNPPPPDSPDQSNTRQMRRRLERT